MNGKIWVAVGLGLLAVAALACSAGFWLFFQPLIPTRLDVNIHEPSTGYNTQAGSYAITLTLRHQGVDYGPVLVDVTSNGQSVGQFESIYNYHLFNNAPAGEMWRTWVDDDFWRDVVISTPLDGLYYISSQDGQLYAVPKN